MAEVQRAERISGLPGACALVDRPNVAVLASHGRDDVIHQTVMWVLRDGDDLLFSTVRGRVGCANLERDPRASVIAYDVTDPEEYVAARGSVRVEPDPERALSNRLARKYTGADHVEADPSAVRLVLRFTATAVVHRRPGNGGVAP